MIGNAIGEILAQIALAFLQAYSARKDLKDSIRAELVVGGYKIANQALQVKADLASRPDHGGDLGVCDDAMAVPLPSNDTDAPRTPDRL